MATDITGIWDLTWTGDLNLMKQHVLEPLSTPTYHRVCFVSEGGNRYKGRFYDPELPQQAYPDGIYHVQIFDSSTPGQGYEVVNIVEHFRSAEDVTAYDAYQTFAGWLRTDYPGEPAPIMFGFVYGNNGDNAVWKMTKNESMGGCPEGLFEG
jgi:hypothetical protein